MFSLDTKLLNRTIGQKRSHVSIPSLYGDQAWVKDLDIVNELGGHSGCVNALSWSTSGSLLASGSDDTFLNVWEYNPQNLARPFTLNTSISTGHTANIFSVKFMPHSNDRTVVSCAGDSEVRVFDLEYSAGSQAASRPLNSTRSETFRRLFSTCRWLSDENTNARIYRSHADRAKRIVTESSPYLFLSCSEDGEVRQWDLRQPSSAYPPPRDGRTRFRSGIPESEVDAPPALISYKNYGLDLNTISCSKSQPHYIALGGAHLHCFLHDRRMLGRSSDVEQGRPTSSTPRPGTVADEEMAAATKCVRRFAPDNRRRMRPSDHGHITACKISDARPNELISSWSGDHVYSFDIVKGPDARDRDLQADETYKVRAQNRAVRKRKRQDVTSNTASERSQPHQRLRRVPDDSRETGQSALLQTDGNSENEGIELEDASEATALLAAHDLLLDEAQQQSERIASALVQLRKTVFNFGSLLQGDGDRENTAELTRHTDSYTKALGEACTLLSDMEEVMNNWRYPQTTDEEVITLENTLRRNRQASWRFVQAAGVLARTMGGKLQTTSGSEDLRMSRFEKIVPAPLEKRTIDDESLFCYDFLRAINLWLQGGKPALLTGFTRPPEFRGQTYRYPVSEETTVDNVAQVLSEYLQPMANIQQPVLDLDVNQFELEERRTMFPDQKVCLIAFIRAVEEIEELRVGHGTSTSVASKRIMDKGAAARFWGEKVGRALLMDAAEGVTFNFVNRAFGGLRIHISADDESLDDLMEDANDDELTATEEANTVEDYANDEVEESDSEGHRPEDDSEESDEDEDLGTRFVLRPSSRGFAAGSMSSRRAAVNSDVPYTGHTKVYKGHCNTRTVKDVNYYGLDDEYIVSGSDDGHFFIWDRKTTGIVGVFEGDGEVVNVIQGHPYEPMIACSGIDSTVKIFGQAAGSRERIDARRGINVAKPGSAQHSSIHFPRRRRTDDDMAEPSSETQNTQELELPEDDESVLKGGLRSRKVGMDKVYEIISQNNTERRRGVGDAFMTQGMLARLALALQNGELQGIEGIGGQGFGGGGGTITLDENCSIM